MKAIEGRHDETIARLNYLRKRFVAIKNDLATDLTVTGELYKLFSQTIIWKIDEVIEHPYVITYEGFDTLQNMLLIFEQYYIKMQQEVEIATEIVSEVIKNEKEDINHHQITDELCGICGKEIAWKHIPNIEGATFENMTALTCCWICFHKIWEGEN